jgi:hypothetical protein
MTAGNTLAEMNAVAGALGGPTATFSSTSTLAAPSLAIGGAGAASLAYGTAHAFPHTNATTAGLVAGGDITSSYHSHLSIDFPYGPTPVSADVSMTFMSTHGAGNALGHSLYDLPSPSLHGLF